MAQVKIIAPQTREAEHLRVAAYCRVSSDSKDQLHSYATQIRSYTEEIAQHDGWELVDVYADEGLTGTRMDRREDFNRMMADCRKGKIDRILVKSVSRFARNTRDCLSALRELSTMGVSVRFEKENIDTKTLTTELMVSVSGSLAQQESISISANQKMSYQRRMERGEFITCTAPYGYRIVNKKDLEIVPEEAATVRWIFDAYLKGRSSGWIAEQLTAKGIPSQSGAECWRETGVRYLLTNEKYIGDALSQKSYSCGFPFVQKRNHGERLQYYLGKIVFGRTKTKGFFDKHRIAADESEWVMSEITHEPLITQDLWDTVHQMMQARRRENSTGEVQPFAGLVKCADCGSSLNVSYDKRKGRYTGFSCWVYKNYGKERCTSHAIGWKTLNQLVLEDIRRNALDVHRHVADYMDMLLAIKEERQKEDIDRSRRELKTIDKRMDELNKILNKLYEDAALEKISEERYQAMAPKYEREQIELRGKRDALTAELARNDEVYNNIQQFIPLIWKYTNIQELTPYILNELIEKIVVHEKEIGADGVKTQQVDIYYKFIGLINQKAEGGCKGEVVKVKRTEIENQPA